MKDNFGTAVPVRTNSLYNNTDVNRNNSAGS